VRKLAIVLLVLLPTVVAAATPSEGVPLKVRRGFFTETDIGGFLTLGGADGYSNLQVYLQLGVGYDITENLEIGLHVGIGANAANCYAERTAAGFCRNASGTDASDNFTNTFVDLSFAYLFRVAERLYVAPKIMGGITLLDPAPVENGAGNPISFAPNVGLAIGVEYATNVDHFTVGLDIVLGRFIIGPNIFTMQFFPRVKYTF
jgi:hypothetical protein